MVRPPIEPDSPPRFLFLSRVQPDYLNCAAALLDGFCLQSDGTFLVTLLNLVFSNFSLKVAKILVWTHSRVSGSSSGCFLSLGGRGMGVCLCCQPAVNLVLTHFFFGGVSWGDAVGDVAQSMLSQSAVTVVVHIATGFGSADTMVVLEGGVP